MKTNPYSQLLDSNQPRFLAFQLQQQQQQQSENRQQTAAWEQSGPQCIDKNLQNPNIEQANQQQQQQLVNHSQQDNNLQQDIANNHNDQYNSNIVVPLNIQQSNEQDLTGIIIPTGITNKKSFVLRILVIYIIEYSSELLSVYLISKTGRIECFANLCFIILPFAIIIPIAALKITLLQYNPASLIVVIINTIVYAVIWTSLAQIGKTNLDKPEESLSPKFGYHVILFLGYQIFFKLCGLLQYKWKLVHNEMQGFSLFLEFQIKGSIISIVCGLPFLYFSLFHFAFVVGGTFVFSNWFSQGLMRVLDEKFGLQQNQAVFASLAVFIFMVCPCL